MLVLSDANNNVVGSYLDGTTVTDLTGVTTLPTPPESQVGVTTVLVIDPTTKTLSYKYVAIGATLADVQASKIAQITDLYNKKLEAGFTSLASGTALQYGYDPVQDQPKWMKLFISMNSFIITYPVSVATKDGTILTLTQDQLKQLLIDINTFEWIQENTMHTFVGGVKAATTVDQVNAIVVAF